MPAMRCAVSLTHDNVRMQHWCAFFFDDVSTECQHLNLLPDGNRFVSFLLPVKKSKFDFAECADRRHLSVSKAIGPGELHELFHDLITFVKDKCKRSQSV